MKLMEYEKFNNVQDARMHRERQLEIGYASAIFNYGDNKFMTHTYTDIKDKDDKNKRQYWLKSRAWNQNDKLRELTTLKEMIDRQPIPDFYTVIETTEDALTFIKPLKEWGWFQKAYEIIDFLERPDDCRAILESFLQLGLEDAAA